MCLAVMIGLLLEGIHYGIRNAVTDFVADSSYKSELSSETTSEETTESVSQALSVYLYDKNAISELDTLGITMDDTMLTIIGDIVCKILDEASVSYQRSTVMGIMGDSRKNEQMSNFFYELVVKIMNWTNPDSNSGEYTIDDLIAVVEKYKDDIESFFRTEIPKYNGVISEEMLLKIEKICEKYSGERLDLKLDDEYLFTHIIEAIMRSFKDKIEDTFTGYLDSVQKKAEDLIKNILDGSGIEYDPNIISGMSYDILHSYDMTGIMFDFFAKYIDLSLKNIDKEVDYVDEISKLIDKNASKIDKFIREELEKYNVVLTDDSMRQLEEYLQNSTGNKINLDKNTNTLFSEALKEVIQSNGELVNYKLNTYKTIVGNATLYAPEFAVKFVDFVIQEENMNGVRAGYIGLSSVSLAGLILAVVPKIGLFKSVGTSGIVAGAVLICVGIAAFLLGPKLAIRYDLEAINSVAASIGSRELTMGAITAGVGIVSTIGFAVATHSAAGTAATAATSSASATAGSPESVQTEPSENTETSSNSEDEKETIKTE